MASQVTPGGGRRRWEAFGEDEQLALLRGEAPSLVQKEAADVGEGVLLGGESAAVGEREHFLRDLFWRPVGVACSHCL